LAELKDSLIAYLKEKQYSEEQLKDVSYLFNEEIDQLVHESILNQEERPDGRALNEIRPLEMALDICLGLMVQLFL